MTVFTPRRVSIGVMGVLGFCLLGCGGRLLTTHVEPYVPVRAANGRARLVVWDDSCVGQQCEKMRGWFWTFPWQQVPWQQDPSLRLGGVRIIDDELVPQVDLLPGQHAAVDLAPGEHTFFAYAWDDVPKESCVAVLKVRLEANHVYIARLSRGEWHGTVFNDHPASGCVDLTLRGVDTETRDEAILALRKSERATFRSSRKWITYVDSLDVRKTVRARGLLRSENVGRLDANNGLEAR